MSDNKKRLDNLSPLKRALVAVEEMKSKLKALQKEKNEPIAVIGLGCRLPGARNPQEFWQLLKNGVDGISEVPPERWDADQLYDPEPGKPGKIITKWGGFIDEVDKFDPQFFGISPREAYKMDPQQRLLLEVTWEALEDAGLVLPRLSKTRTGVFIGISNNDYSKIQGNDLKKIDAYTGIGNAFSIAANRISYTFDLEGPSLSIDTACSSSLVAVHYACQSLRMHESDLALAGGAGLILSPELTVTFSQAQMMSPSGRCRTFDAAADGYVRGEGVGIIVLKRLSDALRDKNHIAAVIRGSAVNQDGKSNGLTAPNSLAQQKVIRRALQNAGVKAEDIDYIEAHGTGTILGDPIEVQALGMVMKERSKERPCYLGSVKTNIGHLEAAAGVAGIIKTVLSLNYGHIPPHLHFKNINPHIAIDELPFIIPAQLTDFPSGKKKRLAGVSAFGFGGTNAHIILEQAPPQPWFEAPENESYDEQAQLIALSAQSENSLSELAEAYGHFADKQLANDAFSFYSLAADCALKRNHLDYRLAIVADGKTDFSQKISAALKNEEETLVYKGVPEAGFRAKTVFVFSGQGPQWWGMGRELMQNEPVFRSVMETISALLQEYTGWSLTKELAASEQESRLAETEVAQPALFAIQVALAELWRSWGVVPDAVTGHSVGEAAAAHISGLLSLEDAVKVIYHRSRLMQKATGLGKMAAIDLTLEKLQELAGGYEDRLSIGAHNSHTSYVLSGNEEALDAVLAKLKSRDVFHKKLPVNYAFHSPAMEPFKMELKEALQGLELQPMHIPLYSTVTGKVATQSDYGPSYWADNIRERVRFSEAIDLLIASGFNVFMEIGPHPVLKNYIRQNLQDSGKSAHILPSLRRKEAERKGMLGTLAKLYTVGYEVDWNKLFSKNAAFLKLPLYPFQKERFWIDAPQAGSAAETDSTVHPLLGKEQTSLLFPDNSNWIVQLKSDYVAYLNPRQQQRKPDLPEAAYLEMAIAASRATFKQHRASLQNIVFKNVLTIRTDRSKQLHFSLSPVSGSKAYFQAYSKADSSEHSHQWILHSLGSVVAETEERPIPTENLEQIRTRLQPYDTIKELLQNQNGNALLYDPTLKAVQKIWAAENEFLIKLHISEKDPNLNAYHINPLLLNTCFRLLNIAAVAKNRARQFYRPHSMQKFQLFRSPDQNVWVHITLNDGKISGRSLESRLTILADSGEVMVLVDGLRLQSVSMEKVLSQLFYEIEWRSIPSGYPRRKIKEIPQRWLIFNDDSERSQNLILKLNIKGKTCLIINKGEQCATIGENIFTSDPRQTQAFHQQISKLLGPQTGVVWLWDNNTSEPANELMRLAAFLNQAEFKPIDFWIFSEQAVSLKERPTATNAAQALLWDVGHYLIKNYPELNIHLADLEEEDGHLFDMLTLPENERHIVQRGKNFFIPRLNRSRPLLSTDFNIDKLPHFSTNRKKPAAHQVEVEIKAAAINGRDLRLLNDEAEEGFNQLGFECSGIVRAVGTQVKTLQQGDAVVLLTSGSLNRFIVAPQNLVKKKPPELSFEQAASIPFSFLTAHYGLTYLARLQHKERVLIHDAVTAHGLAAIAIARSYNCEIYTTVHNRRQERQLRSLGLKNILYNNSLNFVDRISELTEGQGVDIIVNTATNDHLPNSFSILKEFGRFLEFGRDGSFNQPLVYHSLRRNISFFAIDMERVAGEQEALVEKLFEEVLTNISRKIYQLPEFPIFPVSKIGQAFSYLQQQGIDSKCLISFDAKRQSRSSVKGMFSKDGDYLLAASFELNDIALIQWMQENGAENFYLFSLNENDAALKESAKKLRGKINIKIIGKHQFKNLNELNGIIISLSAFPDTLPTNVFLKHTEQFYENTMHIRSDFFASVSSFDLLIGEKVKNAKIQPNHLFLTWNRKRRRAGQSAMHIQLGGKTPANMEQAKNRWNIFGKLLRHSSERLIITEANWTALLNKFQRTAIPGVYQDLLPAGRTEKESAEFAEHRTEISRSDLLLIEDETERRLTLEKYLLAEISKVVKIPAARIKPDQALTTLGIDSLMAIELKNTVESKLGVNLPITALLKGPSVKDLCADFILQLQEKQEERPTKIKRGKKTHTLREFKLSYGQQAMFFQHMMNPDSIFNLAYAVRIRTPFDKELLQLSFQSLVDRHPSLRTTFHLINNEPIQRIHPDMPAFFYEEDLSGQSDEQIRKRLDEEVLSHFDLENGPLMRVFLFQKGKNDFILLFVMHHIVTDIWSQAVLLDELSRIVENAGSNASLPELLADYTDYIRWQDELLASEKGEKLLRYWKGKLAGELPVLNIATDRPRPPVQTFPGQTETIWLPQELSEKIHRFGEEQGVTVFILLLAAYHILLKRYTGQDDIIVGSPTAGRSKNEFAQTIGYFVNPIPFRTDLSGNPDFLTVLEREKQTVLEAFDHMDYPLSLMVEKLQPKRDPSRTPLFQTMFILQRAHLMHEQGLSKFALSREGASLNLGGLTIESMNLEQGVAPFDLTMMAVESGSGLAASLGYNTDLFEAATIRQMLTHYITLLQDIMENPQKPLADLRLLSEREQQKILSQWNDTQNDKNIQRCIHQLFEEQAQRFPLKNALVFEERQYAYRQLNHEANQLAHLLIQQGLRPETIVGICAERSPEMIVAILATLKAGCAYVPIDPTYPQERIRYMLSDSGVSLILTQSGLKARLEAPDLRFILLDKLTELIKDQNTENPQVAVRSDNLAYIIYTSGSTGKPKGTMLQHRGLVNVLQELQEDYHRNVDSHILQFASFSFDASVEEIFSPLIIGATLHLVRRETLLSLADLIHLINEQKITNITLPPSVLSVLQPEDFPHLKAVVSAGEKCPPEIAKRWSQGKYFINGYGPTEATICTTNFEAPENFNAPSVSIGRPIGNVRIYVLDAYLHPVPSGVPGELYISGTGLARGYLNRPDLTAERFLPDPYSPDKGARMYRSGDLVRFLPDGKLEYLARIDQQVKIRGFRIELGEIESVLKQCAQISECAVIARSYNGDNRILAYIVDEKGQTSNTASIKACLKNHLPDYMLPSAIAVLDKLPLTSNGKLNHKALPDPEMQHSGQTFVKPASETERKLALIWQEALSLPQVGINDSFFDLGGHSLGIVQVQGKIKDVFDKELNVVDMFKYPTIRSLAKFLGDESGSKETIIKSQTRAAKQREATRTQQMRFQNRRKRN